MTRPIVFDVAYRGQSALMGVRAGLIARATINRNDFGVGRGVGVRIAASSTVAIEIELEAVQQTAQVQEAAVIATPPDLIVNRSEHLV